MDIRYVTYNFIYRYICDRQVQKIGQAKLKMGIEYNYITYIHNLSINMQDIDKQSNGDRISDRKIN